MDILKDLWIDTNELNSLDAKSWIRTYNHPSIVVTFYEQLFQGTHLIGYLWTIPAV